jgi:hypothetical protein
MERMTASETTNIIVVFESVNANRTRVTWVREELWRNSRMNMVIIVVIVHAIRGNLLSDRCSGRVFCLWFLLLRIDGFILFGNSLVLLSVVGLFIVSNIRSRRARSGVDRVLRLDGRGWQRGIDISDTASSTGWCSHSASGRKTRGKSIGNPGFVLCQWESLIHLIHGHELLLLPSTVWSSRHVVHVDLINVFAIAQGTIAGVVSEAVLDTNNDPVT